MLSVQSGRVVRYVPALILESVYVIPKDQQALTDNVRQFYDRLLFYGAILVSLLTEAIRQLVSSELLALQAVETWIEGGE